MLFYCHSFSPVKIISPCIYIVKDILAFSIFSKRNGLYGPYRP
jgi:hypothetical protein